MDKYLKIASQLTKFSRCKRRKYAALLVQNDELISGGYTYINEDAKCLNNCPREINHIEHNSGNYTDCESKHAEIAALINASPNDLYNKNKGDVVLYLYGYDKNGNVLEDAEPCPTCKKYLKFAGIKKYVNISGEHEL